MRLLLVLSLLSVLVLIEGYRLRTRSRGPLRGCQQKNGECYSECLKGTHEVTYGCDRVKREPTCETPHSVTDKLVTCGYSSCHCDAPTVRDKDSGQCMPLSECPTEEDDDEDDEEETE